MTPGSRVLVVGLGVSGEAAARELLRRGVAVNVVDAAHGPALVARAEALRAAGLESVVHDAVASGRPFLGICIGMQLLYEASEESPGVAGLGVLPGTVRLLTGDVKRPQMQWNTLAVHRPSPLLAELPHPAWVYFVHSYAAADPASPDVVATCDYGGPVVAAVERGNVAATQFHPEKSGANGLRVLGGFVGRCGARAAAAS